MNIITNKIFGPKLGGYNFQDSGNLFMDNIIYFHDLVMCILIFISALVIFFLFRTLLFFGNHNLYIINYFIFLIIQNVLFFILNHIIAFIMYFYDLFSLIYQNYEKHDHSFGDSLVLFLYFYNPSDINKLYIYSDFEHIKNIFNQIYEFGLNSINVNSLKFKNDINYRYYFYADVKLEFIWTLFPSLILLFLAIPSFGILFSVEKVGAPELTVKVIGHQWYWEYQYLDFCDFNQIIETENNTFIYKNKNVDEDHYILESYMIFDDDLPEGGLRLLDVDNKLMLPINTNIRLYITSDDVLHSWAVPSLGIKVDACPGRLNEIIIKIRETGIYYGQCSELCGWYHGFMPISIQALPVEDFKIWATWKFLKIGFITKETQN